MKPSFWEQRRLIRESSLPIRTKWLLTVLCDYAGESEWAFPSQETLARDLSVCKRQAKRLLKQAIDKKLIQRRRRRRATNQYRICWENMGDGNVPSKDVLEVTVMSPMGDGNVPPMGDKDVPLGGAGMSPRTSKEHPEGTSKEHKSEKNGKQAEEIYQAYPRKIAKPKALKAIEAALKKTSFDNLLTAVQEYAKSRDGQDSKYTPHAATFFNQERWNDDRSDWQSSNGRPGKRRVGAGEKFDPDHKATL